MSLEVKQSIDKIIQEINSPNVTRLYENISMGKQVRAKLIFAIAGKNERSIKLATIIETIHLASLLHDDVIDESQTRRSKPSINALYGNKQAIMLGDILYSEAFKRLVDFEKEIAKSVSNAVSKLSLGELLDVDLGNDFNINEDLYLNMIYLKTAALIEATTYCAAVLANKNCDEYGEFGKSIGISFQIIDDILDITQDEKTLGKPAMHDLKEKKTTLPYIYLYKKLDQNNKQKLLSLFGKDLSLDEKKWLKDNLIINDCVKKSKDLAINLVYRSKEIIDSNKELANIVQMVVSRSF